MKIFALHNKRAAIDEAISESKKKLAAIELKAMEVIPPSNSLEHESIKFKFFTRSTKLCEGKSFHKMKNTFIKYTVVNIRMTSSNYNS